MNISLNRFENRSVTFRTFCQIAFFTFFKYYVYVSFIFIYLIESNLLIKTRGAKAIM